MRTRKIISVAVLSAALLTAQTASITSLTPSSAPAGSPATSLTIAGQNIASGSSVSWTTPGGQTVTLAPGLVQSAQLAATIPASLLSTAGTARVAVVNGAGVLSNQLPFQITTSFIVISASLPAGTMGTSYGSGNFSAANGSAPYSWAIIPGALPPGLSVDPVSGVVSGTPQAPGTYYFGVQATDAAGRRGIATSQITIAPLPVQFTTNVLLPSAIAGLDYSDQVLGATGGFPPYTFTVSSGNLPSGLTLTNGVISGIPVSPGTATFSLKVADSSAPPLTSTLATQIVVRAGGSPALLTGAGSATFAIGAGSASLPAPVVIPVGSSATGTILNYSVSVSSGAPWLTVTSGATTPGYINIALNSQAAGLQSASSSYQATVTLTCVAPSACAGSAQTIPVTLTVAALPTQLTVNNAILPFTASSANAAPPAQSLNIQNAGGGTLNITSITGADSWVTVGSYPATLSGGPSTAVAISVDPTKTGPGFYTSSVTVISSAGRVTVPVTFFVGSASLMTLEPAGQLFTMTAGGAVGNPAEAFAVGISSGSAINYTASVLPGATWLILKTAAGSASTGAPGTIQFSIDPVAAGLLSPQAYYGTIRVTGSGIVNAPQDFQVILSVLPPGVKVAPDPDPAGLVFTAGTSKPPAQSIQLRANSASSIAYQASTNTTDGHAWLAVTPATGTTIAGTPAQSSISVDPSVVGAGIYQGTVSYSYSGSTVRSVNVTLVVPSSGSVPGSAARPGLQATGVCAPTKVVPTQTELAGNFSAPASWPIPLTLNLLNDCGGAVANGQVAVTFSNGDAPLALSVVDQTHGIYAGTWSPRNTSNQMTITVAATAPGLAAAKTQITGQVKPNTAPTLVPNGVLQIFEYTIGRPLAPGNVIQMYGSGLAAGAVFPSVVPLPVSLGGTSVLIGGLMAPLFYVGPTQIDAQIPFELAPNAQYQVVVNANGALSSPQTIQVDAAAPSLLASSSDQVVAQHAADYSLVSEASPAQPGEYLVLYLAGMGGTDVPVASGALSPGLNAGDQLAHPQATPALTLNGVPVSIYFAGLTPGYAGLYQVTFQVPANSAEGELPLVISQAGSPSNTTVLPVRRP